MGLHMTLVMQVALPEGIEPLILWQPGPGEEGPPVVVDPMLTRWLRPHQREGVAFMFECVAGLRGFAGNGEETRRGKGRDGRKGAAAPQGFVCAGGGPQCGRV